MDKIAVREMPETLMPVAEQHDPERFVYFGYGSNMLTRRLTDPKRAPSARALGVGYVDKHRLTFDKISRGTRQNSGKCDMEATGGAESSLRRTVQRLERGRGVAESRRRR